MDTISLIILIAIAIVLYILFRKEKPVKHKDSANFSGSKTSGRKSLKKDHDLYFQILDEIKKESNKGNVKKLLSHCLASYSLIDGLIKYTKKEYGKFDIKNIPAISYGLIYFSIYGRVGQLKNIEELVNKYPELTKIYAKDVEEAFLRKELAKKIYDYVKSNPDCKETDLKTLKMNADYQFIRETVRYMEKAGLIDKRTVKNKVRLRPS